MACKNIAVLSAEIKRQQLAKQRNEARCQENLGTIANVKTVCITTIPKTLTIVATTYGLQVNQEAVVEVQSVQDISTRHRKSERNTGIQYSKKTELRINQYMHVFFNCGDCTVIFTQKLSKLYLKIKIAVQCFKIETRGW